MTRLHRYFTVLVLLVLSCSNIMIANQWSIIHGAGITADNSSFKFLVFSQHRNALLMGSSWTDRDLINKQFNNFNAVAYSSVDSAHNWAKIDFGKGELTSCASKDSFICSTLRRFPDNTLSPSKDDSTLVYFSNDFGKKWQLISKLNDLYVQRSFVQSSKEVVIVGKKGNGKEWTIEKTSDQGLTWMPVGELPGDMYSLTLLDDDLFCLSHKNPYVILKMSLKKKTVNTISISDSSSKPYMLCATNNELYLCNSTAEKLDIYTVNNEDFSFKYIASVQESKFPVAIYSSPNRLTLILGSRNSVGVTYSVYSRQNHNKKWNKTSVPTALFDPFNFDGENLVGYSNDGNFYTLDLSKAL